MTNSSNAISGVDVENITRQFKPCPFCGWAEPRMLRVESDADFADDFSVSCLECGAIGPNRETAFEATAAWNMRAGQ